MSARKTYFKPVSPDVPPVVKSVTSKPVAVSVKSRLAVTKLFEPVKSNPYWALPIPSELTPVSGKPDVGVQLVAVTPDKVGVFKPVKVDPRLNAKPIRPVFAHV
jgi:hypothetical protein